VDAEDAFSLTPPPRPACNWGLLWVRCGHSAEHALKAADLLIQGGGFGLVVMDLAIRRRHRAASRWHPGSPAPRRGTYSAMLVLWRGNPTPGPAPPLVIECGRKRPPERRAFRLPPAALYRGARPIHPQEEAMFLSSRHGNLTRWPWNFRHRKAYRPGT